MSVTDKVKAVMSMSGKKNTDLAEYLGLSSQSLSNKLSRGSFSAEDLIRIADFCGCSLLFEYEDDQRVKLSMDDLRKLEKAE